MRYTNKMSENSEDATNNKSSNDGTLPDMSRHVGTRPDNSHFTLTVEEASALFANAGVPRSPRTIARFCQQGHLDYIRVETEKNSKFLIDRNSVEKRIKELQQAFSVTENASVPSGHVETPVGTSPDMSRQREAPQGRETSAREKEDMPSSRERELSERIISRLEKENEELRADKVMLFEQMKIKDDQLLAKDRQIDLFFASEKDTKRITTSLQNLMSYLWPGTKRDEGRGSLPQTFEAVVRDIPEQPNDGPGGVH